MLPSPVCFFSFPFASGFDVICYIHQSEESSGSRSKGIVRLQIVFVLLAHNIMQRIESWAPEKPLNDRGDENQYANNDGLYLSLLSNLDILTKGFDLQFSLFNIDMKKNRRWTILDIITILDPYIRSIESLDLCWFNKVFKQAVFLLLWVLVGWITASYLY